MVDVSEYLHMWTTDIGKYVLVQINPDDKYDAVIFDKERCGAVVIEDEVVSHRVIDEMRMAGAEITSEVPS